MTTLDQIATRIIKEQELIIGPIAWQEAGEVEGMHIVDQKAGTVSIDDSDHASQVVDKLVDKYEHLFGRASREVCKEAAAPLIAELSQAEIPSSLR